MTHEELNEVLTDIRPILNAYPECRIDVETTDSGILLTPVDNGFTGSFLNAIGEYFKANSCCWYIVVIDGKVKLDVF